MITGVHHVCVKCRPEELEKVQKFYGELLGLPLVRSWGEPKVEGLMYGAGTSLIEIFPNAEEDLPQGAIRHFALATDDVDSIVETVRKAGYAVTMEPVDIEIMSKPSLPARIAFIIGPVGEENRAVLRKTIECTLCEHSIVMNKRNEQKEAPPGTSARRRFLTAGRQLSGRCLIWCCRLPSGRL